MFDSPSRETSGAVRLAIFWVCLAASSGLVACNTGFDESAQGCVPGRLTTCSCPNGQTGRQACGSDGTYGRCQCDGAIPSDEVSDVAGDGSRPDTSAPGMSRDSSQPDPSPADGAGESTDAEPDPGPDPKPDPEKRRRVELPVEVMGPDGTTRSVEIDIDKPDRVERLFIRAHSIGYPYHYIEKRGYETPKASIRINGGEWVDVTNDNVTCRGPEAEARCVNGPFHTIDLTMPVSRLGDITSVNQLDFRFNYANPEDAYGDPSSGYRILDIEFRDAQQTDRIEAPTFEFDDPACWTAPVGFDNAEAVEEGKRLWQARDQLTDGWNGPDIKAACADCHTDSGYDLQYFSYSNHSIVERAKFHSLSEKQGKKIAAYIRSIDLETEQGKSYSPPGRPWDPPYQPGPTAQASRTEGQPRTKGEGFDKLPPAFWAAGAGLEWELTNDDKVKKHLFPNGITYDGQVEIDESLNVRQLPVALQMPDWNAWLPVHHPMDVWGDDFLNSDVWERYTEDIPEALNTGKASEVKHAAKWLHAVSANQVKMDPFRPGSAPDEFDLGIASSSRVQWGLVKTFEVLHVNHFENDARDVYGDNAARLQWLSSSRIVFDQAPHITGTGKPRGDRDGIIDTYNDALWYHLQIVMNSGQGFSIGHSPTDWKYHFAHISAPGGVGGWQAWRYLASYIRVIQNAEHLGDSHSRSEHWPEGWYLRHTTPTYLSRDRSEAGPLTGLSDSEYRKVLNTVGKSWIEGVTEEPIDEWSRGTGKFRMEPESFEPRIINRYQPGTGTCCEYASHIYTVAQKFKDWGLKPELVRELSMWGKRLWPSASNPSWDDIASN